MLKKLFSSIVKTASTIGSQKLNELKNFSPLLNRLANILILAGRDIIMALLDKDKDNAAQLQKILKVHTNSIITEGAELGKEKLLSFHDIKLATAAVIYLDGAEELLKSLIDDNPDNEGQARAIIDRYKERVLAPTVDIATDKIADLIRAKVNDPIIANLVIEVLQSLDELVKTDTPEPAPLLKKPAAKPYEISTT